MWKKAVDWAKLTWSESWTKFLAWSAGLPSAVLLALSYINDIITDPTFKGYLDVISVPKWATVSMTVFSMLVWLAHGRKNDTI